MPEHGSTNNVIELFGKRRRSKHNVTKGLEKERTLTEAEITVERFLRGVVSIHGNGEAHLIVEDLLNVLQSSHNANPEFFSQLEDFLYKKVDELKVALDNIESAKLSVNIHQLSQSEPVSPPYEATVLSINDYKHLRKPGRTMNPDWGLTNSNHHVAVLMEHSSMSAHDLFSLCKKLPNDRSLKSGRIARQITNVLRNISTRPPINPEAFSKTMNSLLINSHSRT